MKIRCPFLYSWAILLLSIIISPISVLAIDQKIDVKRPANISQQGDETVGHKLERSGNTPSKGRVTIGQKLEVTHDYLEHLANSPKNYPAGLTSGESVKLRQIITDIKANNNGAANSKWRQLIYGIKEINRSRSMDINSLVQQVLREAYLETSKDLRYAAYKVTFYNEQKKQVRQNLDEARSAQTEFMSQNKSSGGNGKKQKSIFVKTIRSIPTPSPNKKYFPKVVAKPRRFDDKQNLDDYIKEWEEKLSEIGDDEQQANNDLQNIMQKQQQTVQTMSNISKMLHDSAMAIIGKIGE